MPVTVEIPTERWTGEIREVTIGATADEGGTRTKTVTITVTVASLAGRTGFSVFFEAEIAEGRELAKIAENITIKVPLTWDGLKACKVLTGEGRMVNVTLCFSANQALLAAKAGATFISPFIGRLDDINLDGMDLIADIREIYDNYGFETQILAASIRSANHMSDAAKIGADVATAPPDVIKKMAQHPLTDKGLEGFLKDWAKTGQKIV